MSSDTNLHETYTNTKKRNLRGISPFDITPVEKAQNIFDVIS